MTEEKISFKDCLDNIIDNIQSNWKAYLITAAIVGLPTYHFRCQEIKDAKVVKADRDMSYCGDAGEFECWNPIYEFEGVKGCFRDKSFKGCYSGEDNVKLHLEPDEGENIGTVTYRNPILPPWGCKVIKKRDPSPEKMAGRPTFWDYVVCGFR